MRHTDPGCIQSPPGMRSIGCFTLATGCPRSPDPPQFTIPYPAVSVFLAAVAATEAERSLLTQSSNLCHQQHLLWPGSATNRTREYTESSNFCGVRVLATLTVESIQQAIRDSTESSHTGDSSDAVTSSG